MAELPAVRVEMDVFSGRANPTWSLTAGEVEELTGRLRQLPPGGQMKPRGLGWRGFVLHRVTRRGTDRPWVRIADGAVSLTGGSRSRTYRDTVGIESWLRDQARQRGFGHLVGDAPSE
jgi:hypothetical protein